MPQKPKPPTQPEKVRLNLELSQPVYEQLQALQHHTGAASLTEVFRRSLALYDLVTEHLSSGGKILLRDTDGTEEGLKIL